MKTIKELAEIAYMAFCKGYDGDVVTPRAAFDSVPPEVSNAWKKTVQAIVDEINKDKTATEIKGPTFCPVCQSAYTYCNHCGGRGFTIRK